jgi:putative alpha-1,2-mannosidase
MRMYILFPFFRGRTKSLPRNGIVTRDLGETHLVIGDAIESGALFSFAGTPTEVIIRVGISFVSGDQACANAASEIGTATFDEIQAQSKALWNEMLSRIEIVVPRTPPDVTELLYSSLYRASLTPVSLSFSKLRSNS